VSNTYRATCATCHLSCRCFRLACTRRGQNGSCSELTLLRSPQTSTPSRPCAQRIESTEVPLNRAKESHQSTIRAPLSNSPAVSLSKTALSPTSCASAADFLCYADCRFVLPRQAQHALSNITLSALLLFANCNLPLTSFCRSCRLVGPRFPSPRISAKPGFCCSAYRISLLRLTRASAVCSLSHRVPIFRHSDNIPVAAYLNSMLKCFPEKQSS
jgi:hypothetical protein